MRSRLHHIHHMAVIMTSKPLPKESTVQPSRPALRSIANVMPQLRTVVAEEIDRALRQFLAARADNPPDDEALIQQAMEKLPGKEEAHQWQLAQNAGARNAFRMQCGGLLSSKEVADLLGSTARNRAALAKQLKDAGKALSVRLRNQDHYPGFQFDHENQRLYPEMAEILALLAADYDYGWQMALWFSCNNDWLDGKTPLAVWPGDRSAVVDAARAENALFHG
jgi:hypothetical protein